MEVVLQALARAVGVGAASRFQDEFVAAVVSEFEKGMSCSLRACRQGDLERNAAIRATEIGLMRVNQVRRSAQKQEMVQAPAKKQRAPESPPSSYELQRRANMKHNREKMAALGLS